MKWRQMLQSGNTGHRTIIKPVVLLDLPFQEHFTAIYYLGCHYDVLHDVLGYLLLVYHSVLVPDTDRTVIPGAYCQQ